MISPEKYFLVSHSVFESSLIITNLGWEKSRLMENFDIRDYGISKCIISAKEIFTPEIINNWSRITEENRLKLVLEYGKTVSKNFDLKEFHEIIIKELGFGVYGETSGDGYIYISESLVKNDMSSPLQIIDTLTHEMRHQFQMESLNGLHKVPQEIINEWRIGETEYTNSPPYVFDPWGYKYNPLELDARYAGETVVREFTKDYRA